MDECFETEWVSTMVFEKSGITPFYHQEHHYFPHLHGRRSDLSGEIILFVCSGMYFLFNVIREFRLSLGWLASDTPPIFGPSLFFDMSDKYICFVARVNEMPIH